MLCGPILALAPGDPHPRCAVCETVDALGRAVVDVDGWHHWTCRSCDDTDGLVPELPGQQALDVGDADALEGELLPL